MRRVLMSVAMGCVVGCSAPMVVDSGVTMDAGQVVDAGTDAGVFSACGHPGDLGNSVKVGQYCKAIAECPGSAPICTSFQNSGQPANLQSYFCTTGCDPCDPPSVCGENALCVCQGAGQCGCVPQTCAALIPDGGVVACQADAG
jgi:hypothetical protein